MTTDGPPPVTRIVTDVCRAITFDDLPAEAVTVAKQCVLDWLGVTIAGASEPLARILRDVAESEGGAGQATLIPDGARVTCSQAALVNGSTSHALDYDDVAIAMGHPTVPILAALLALAEQRDASGRAFLAALVAGHEMEGRVAAMVMPGHYSLGFHST
ncbi:MAG: MmgE/PrpD family protein, partial [Tepidiformaceae bacterium]